MDINQNNFVKDLEIILKADDFKNSIDFTLKKYNLKDYKFSTILENSDFRRDLYETLKKLLIFYDEGEYYQEKYILLVLHLIFGVNPIEKNKISQKNVKNQNIKNKNLIIENLEDNYIEQNEKMEEILSIIFKIIKKIQKIQNKNKIESNELTEEEDIEYEFESDIKEFFLGIILYFFILYIN
jgi:hypothetical protein